MTPKHNSSKFSNRAVLTVPCPLCRYVFNCPFAGRPRDECLDLWPLGRPAKRELVVRSPDEPVWQAKALRTPWLREILAVWQRGDQITDKQYLALRGHLLATLGQDFDGPTWYVLQTVLWNRIDRFIGDAIRYYELPESEAQRLSRAGAKAMFGAIVCARGEMVAKDVDSPVQSHFERLFSDFFKWLLWEMLGMKMLELPQETRAFEGEFKREWCRLLRYGNGYFGFTIIPRISILDMVRYQQLGRGDKTISGSVANYVIWTMDTFPPGAQLVLPKIREVAFKRRLIAMFHPLVEVCAWEANRRLKFWGNQHGNSDRQRLKQEFAAVLSRAIDDYSFMYGKAGTWEDGVGMVGLGSDPELRERIDAAMQALGLAVTSKDLAHVSVAHFLSTRLRQHLREHHPVTPRDSAASASIDAPLGEAGSSLAESVQSTSEILKSSPPAGNSKVVACEVDGVKYLFIDEMALLCGVTSKQLRHWEDSSLVRAQRLGDIAPQHRGKVSAQWRVYPYTPQMIEKISATALRRATRCADLAEDEYNRSGAAQVLGYSAKTLKRWEKQGIAQPIWRDNRPIYRVEEIHRLETIKGRKV